MAHPSSFAEALVQPHQILDTHAEEKHIGKGTFGSVTVVPSADGSKLYAVKRLANGFENDKFILNFLREIETQVTLNDPEFSIFRGFHLPSADDESYQSPMLFMDYLEGGALGTRVNEEESDQPLNQTQRAIILYGLAIMVEYMHSKNVVHRDLKPDNILLTRTMEPRISDFGSARKIASRMSAEVGTPIYMAPEIVDGTEEADKKQLVYGPKADVFSLGLIMWQILNRETPYYSELERSRSPYQDLQNFKKNGVIPDAKCEVMSRQMSDIIAACTASKARQRPDARQVREMIDQLTPEDFGTWNGCDSVDGKAYAAYVRRMKNHFLHN